MEFTSLTIRLLLLFFPGIVCYVTVDTLTVHRDRKTHEVFLLSFVYGVLAYLIYSICKALGNTTLDQVKGLYIPPPKISFLTALAGDVAKIDVIEICAVTILAVILGIAVSVAFNRYWIHDAARWFKITKKFGQPDVWSFAFNTNEVEWATIRDLERNQMFQGYIRAFSDIEEGRKEVLLTEVTVYNETTGERLYEADHMYLARNRDNITIEFQLPENQ